MPALVIASIPLLIVYFSERGNTSVLVSNPLRPLFGSLINLGGLIEGVRPSLNFGDFWARCTTLHVPSATFSTSGINILTGINGSEVSQAIINDLLCLPWLID